MPPLLRWTAAGLLVGAVAPWPYAYYQVLRWVISPTALFLAVDFGRNGGHGRAWTWAVVGVLFNPLWPVHFDRLAWNIVDVVVAALFLLVSHREDVPTKGGR